VLCVPERTEPVLLTYSISENNSKCFLCSHLSYALSLNAGFTYQAANLIEGTKNTRANPHT